MSEHPNWLPAVKDAALRAVSPLRPGTDGEVAAHPSILWARRVETATELPPHYIVYFLLVELLNFPHRGIDEKVAWTIPVVLDDNLFAIQHRKLGLGVFALSFDGAAEGAEQIARLIRRSANAGKKYFDWKAEAAVKTSRLNVVNRSSDLYERFRYFRDKYRGLLVEAADRKDEHATEIRDGVTMHYPPSFELAREAEHYAIAAIEAFYSWTEHIFVQLATMNGHCPTGADVADLARADWSTKYKTALGLEEPTMKRFFDQLLALRRQVRNFTAHGAFGKDGEAFRFHSAAGAVPVLLNNSTEEARYSLVGYAAFSEGTAIELIAAFVEHLWDDARRPARLYLESELPIRLTLAVDGTYEDAMQSEVQMQSLIDDLNVEIDRAENMDW
jgi:hypothetical protein